MDELGHNGSSKIKPNIRDVKGPGREMTQDLAARSPHPRHPVKEPPLKMAQLTPKLSPKLSPNLTMNKSWNLQKHHVQPRAVSREQHRAKKTAATRAKSPGSRSPWGHSQALQTLRTTVLLPKPSQGALNSSAGSCYLQERSQRQVHAKNCWGSHQTG